MKFAAARWEFDLSKMEDEALAILAPECPKLGARQELMTRHFPNMCRFVAARAKGQRLSREDLEDAEQNAALGIDRAIDNYNFREIGRRGGNSFRSFLPKVVSRDLKDFLKSRRRRQSHLDDSSVARHALKEVTENLGRRGRLDRPIHQDSSNPADAAMEHEESQRLQLAVSKLPEKLRQILEGMMSGKKLSLIGRQMGITYETAREWRDKMYRMLAALLRSKRSIELPNLAAISSSAPYSN